MEGRKTINIDTFYNSQTHVSYQNSYLLECQFLDDSDKFVFAFSFLKFLH